MGSLSLQPAQSMWEIVDALVDEARESARVVLVDVHAEATSEKVALARWLDGRVTAVIGTHTHVQTVRCARAAGRHGCDHRRGHDRPARLGDRRQGRARDAADAHGDAGALRGRDGRSSDRGRPRRVRSGERPGIQDHAGSGSLAVDRRWRADDEHGEQRHEREVADEHEPRRGRVELLHELPVGAREPEPRQPAGEERGARSRRRRGGPGRARRCRAATSGTAAR